MGNDGGVIAVKRKFMRHGNIKDKKDGKDKTRLRLMKKATTCALTDEKLKSPIAVCRLGNLYNKKALLERLLSKSMPEELCYIQSMKDIVNCKWTSDEECYTCPITKTELNGVKPFVVLAKCGCVVAEKVYTEIDTKVCLVCGSAFSKSKDMIKLFVEGEEEEKLRSMLMEKRMKKVKKSVLKVPKKKKVLGKVGDKSKVYASLFTKKEDKPKTANDLLMTVAGLRYTLS